MAEDPKPRKRTKSRRTSRKDAIDVALELVAEQGWFGFDLPDVAARAGIPLTEFSRDYWTKSDLLTAFQRRIDERVLAAADTDADDETPRDRLFDILMQRFDALQPYRPALAALARDLPKDPATALTVARNLRRSMAWMAAAAKLPTNGIQGALILKGLILVWTVTARTWLTDDSSDMSKTMAALDKALTRAEAAAATLSRYRRDGMADASD